MNLKRIVILISCACSAAAYSAEPADDQQNAGLGAAAYVSSDNEDFTTLRETAEYRFASSSWQRQFGVRLRHHHFMQNDWSREAGQILLTGKGNTGDNALIWEGEAGVLQQSDKQLLTMDATVHANITPITSIEAFINRDYVETAAALDRGIHATYVGASIERILNPHFTAVALAGRQSFSDGNERTHGRLRLIYQPSLDLGLTLQYRYRYYTSDENEVRRAYFNPEHYRENMLMGGWRKRSKDWSGALLAGLGRQSIDEEGSSPTKLLEASYQRTLENKQALSLGAGFSQSASVGGPDYKYGYINLNWSMQF